MPTYLGASTATLPALYYYVETVAFASIEQGMIEVMPMRRYPHSTFSPRQV
jgi:hypothetical protein